MRHPESEQLLRYIDGELPARTAGAIRLHLESCWQCRASLEELQNTIGKCVRYRKNVLQRYSPSPPAPWIDIYRGFAAIDASMEPDFFRNRKIWAIAAVALLVLGGLFYRFRQTPSVHAAELLRRAVAAAAAHPVKARRIEIRTRKHRLTRLASSHTRPVGNAADTDTLNSLQALFVAANYDWNDPLSARSYQSWHDQLSDKQDAVVEEADAYRVRTTTPSGELAVATLKLRMRDLQPVEERLEFRNREWVEITEAPVDSAAELAAATAPASTSGNPRTRTSAVGTATLSDEIYVLAALHQVGADLGDPIEVSRSGGAVLVQGVGIAPRRQQEIAAAVRSNPRVVVRFSNSAAPTGQPEKQTVEQAGSGGDMRQLQARVAEQIGGRVPFDRMAGQVLDLSEAMMARVYALRRIGERFPPEVQSALSPEDLKILRHLRQEHMTALRKTTDDLDRVLTPVLESIGGIAGTPGQTTPGQPAPDGLLQSAHRVEKLLAVMFGETPGESGDAQLPSQLLSSLAELRAKTEAYDRVATQGPERRDR